MTVHYEDRGPRGGDAPPVLLAGSLGTTLRVWDPQVDALTGQGRRTIAYDQRGHGASPVPPGPYSIADLGADALALMDHLEIARASFVGLSIGGMVGQWLAAHAPERIDRLVLLCTTAHLPPAQSWHDRAAAVRAAGTVDVIADAVVARWVTPAYAAARPDAVEALRAMLAAQPPEGYAACCEAIAAMDLRDELAAIAAPALVIGGAQDPAIPTEHQRHLATHIAGARLEILDPGAHVVSVERPDAVTALIAEHLDRDREREPA
ncbi:MAG TPA: 3-oxoadipate enol-lactonase [Baekduia sp.]|nr:3-oxoadipate enol-lactonase [Baekduia sp.]